MQTIDLSRKKGPANAMRLLRDKWLPIFKEANRLEKMLISKRGYRHHSRQEEGMKADYMTTEAMLLIAETIVLPSDMMLQLIRTLDRIDTRGEVKMPYPYVCIQFTHPIDEALVMDNIEKIELIDEFGLTKDRVEGIIIGNSSDDPRFQSYPFGHIFNLMNCSVLFESTAVNRVAWRGTERPAEVSWEHATFGPHEIPEPALRNKNRMIKLCYAVNLFLNAPNVIIHKEKPDPRVNAKREKKGKAVLPEYHTVTINKEFIQYKESNKGSGTPHTRMYPVRGHFRRLKQFENPIWIPNHFRGLQWGEESIQKNVYRVRPKNSSPDSVDSQP